MRNPLSLPVERAIAAGLLGACLWLWLSSERARAGESAVARAELQDAARRIGLWKANYAKAVTDGVTVADTVTRFVTRHAVDTLWIHDTLHVAGDTVQRTLVPTRTVARLDSTVRSCGHLAQSVVPIATACDSLRAALTARGDAYQSLYKATRPRIWDRLGVSVGYGLTQAQGRVYAGPQVGLSVRLWP